MKMITEEANAANHIKHDLPIMVVIGNPPYFGRSSNRSWKIVEKVKGQENFRTWAIDKEGKAKALYRTTKQSGQKREPTFIGKLIRDYYICDGKWLGERNPKWLQDDYVKFIRWAQWRIERTGAGILAFITNHGVSR